MFVLSLNSCVLSPRSVGVGHTPYFSRILWKLNSRFGLEKKTLFVSQARRRRRAARRASAPTPNNANEEGSGTAATRFHEMLVMDPSSVASVPSL